MGISGGIHTGSDYVVSQDLNKNKARIMSQEMQEMSSFGLTAFAPLKSKTGKKATIIEYIKLVVKYFEEGAKGIHPKYYALCKEALEYHKQGATAKQVNARYKLSIDRLS